MLLIEYNRNEILNTLKNILKSKNFSDNEIEKILITLEEIDPTRSSQKFRYVPMMVNFIKNSYINPTEIYSAAFQELWSEILEIYDEAKKMKLLDPKWLDVNNAIKSFRDFNNFESYVRRDAKTIVDLKKAEKEKDADKGKYDIVFENEQFTFIEHYDKTSAIYFGRGTTWCTAATKSHNYFDSYNRRYRIITIIPKKPLFIREKYQMDFVRFDPKDPVNTIQPNSSEILVYNYLDDILHSLADEWYFDRTPPNLYQSILAFTKKYVNEYLDHTYASVKKQSILEYILSNPYINISYTYNDNKYEKILKDNLNKIFNPSPDVLYSLLNDTNEENIKLVTYIPKFLFFMYICTVYNVYKDEFINGFDSHVEIKGKYVKFKITDYALPWIYFNRPFKEYLNCFNTATAGSAGIIRLMAANRKRQPIYYDTERGVLLEIINKEDDPF